jgi:hypothetical protein
MHMTAVRIVVLFHAGLTLVLTACGGAQEPGDASRMQPVDEALVAKALALSRDRAHNRPQAEVIHELSQPQATVRPVAYAVPPETLSPASPTAKVPSAESCLKELAASSLQRRETDPIDLRCMAGAYRGRTPEGDACALEIAPFDGGRFKLSLSSAKVSVEKEDSGARMVHKAATFALPGEQTGIQLSRATEAEEARSDVVTLRSTPRGSGPARLIEMTYVSRQVGKAREINCRFATLQVDDRVTASTR